MEPFKEEPAAAAPANVNTAKWVMIVQGVLPIVLGVVVAAMVANRNRAHRQTGRNGAAGLFLLIELAIIVLLIVTAIQLPSLRPSVRTRALWVEGVLAVLSLLGLARNPVGTVITLGLAGTVIYLLTRPDTKAAFTGGASTRAGAPPPANFG